MEEKDRKRFLGAIAKTRITLPGINLTEKEEAIRIQIFWEELSDFPIEKVEEAFRLARRELHFFPKPAEIINFIRGAKLSPEGAYLKYLEENTRATLKTLDYRPSKEEAKRALDKIRALLDPMPTPESKPISPTLTDPDKAKRFEELRQALLKQRKGKP